MPAAVAFNALPLRPDGAGVSTYIKEILSALVPLVAGEMVAVVGADARSCLPGGVTAVCLPPADGLRRAAQGLRRRAEAPVIHGLDVDLPAGSKSLLIATVHDLSVFDVPWAFPAVRVAAERLLVTQAVRRADAVIAVSSFTAERIKAVLGREAVVIPEAAPSGMVPAHPTDVERVRSRYDLPARFVLHVGTVEPRKNVPALAEACRLAGIPLVAVGGPGWKAALPASVRALGSVPGGDLPGLYGAATVTAYASVYEGFGLPPLEAMACGSPVMSTPVPAVGLVGDAALVVESGLPVVMARALSELVHDDDQRAERAAAGLRAVKSLRWSDTAMATAAVYQAMGVTLTSAGAAGPGAVIPPVGSGGVAVEVRRGVRALWRAPFVNDPGRTAW